VQLGKAHKHFYLIAKGIGHPISYLLLDIACIASRPFISHLRLVSAQLHF